MNKKIIVLLCMVVSIGYSGVATAKDCPSPKNWVKTVVTDKGIIKIEPLRVDVDDDGVADWIRYTNKSFEIKYCE